VSEGGEKPVPWGTGSEGDKRGLSGGGGQDV
jgi:hypothetical protein